NGGDARDRPGDGRRWTGERRSHVIEPDRRRQVVSTLGSLLGRLERRHVVIGAHVKRDTGGYAVHREDPRYLLVLAELFRHGEEEHAVTSSGQKVRGLTEIGTAGFEMIHRTNRHVDLALRVAVEVANQKTVRAVSVIVPAFVGRSDACAESLGRR